MAYIGGKPDPHDLKALDEWCEDFFFFITNRNIAASKVAFRASKELDATFTANHIRSRLKKILAKEKEEANDCNEQWRKTDGE